MTSFLLFALLAVGVANFLQGRLTLRRLAMAQADIDTLTARVEAVKVTVEAYVPPAGAAPDDLTGLTAAVGDLEAAVASKLQTPSA